ncbi:hypothetical protein ACIFOT_29765, partial [Neobacillus sp. NRS-1170]|uniref:hypothetical protein n=1 Tax=Neobacillus sp. NRS-1170 TaxID=3233898 RepID=UPI003D2922BE
FSVDKPDLEPSKVEELAKSHYRTTVKFLGDVCEQTPDSRRWKNTIIADGTAKQAFTRGGKLI